MVVVEGHRSARKPLLNRREEGGVLADRMEVQCFRGPIKASAQVIQGTVPIDGQRCGFFGKKGELLSEGGVNKDEGTKGSGRHVPPSRPSV